MSDITPYDVDPWLTADQAAAVLQLHVATIYREIKAGRLRHARVAGRTVVRIRRSWLDDWLERTAKPVEVESRR